MIDTTKITIQITTINKEIVHAKKKYNNYDLYTTYFLEEITKDIETTINALENTTEGTKKHDTITSMRGRLWHEKERRKKVTNRV